MLLQQIGQDLARASVVALNGVESGEIEIRLFERGRDTDLRL